MLRKHFNSMHEKELCMLPFHSWNCISLEMSHREIDLVIKREKDMDILLKFLIRNLRTVDGVRNSANRIIK